MKPFLIGVAVLLAALLVWRLAGMSDAKEQQKRGDDKAVAVEVAEPRRADISDVRIFTGSIEAGSYFVVAPKVGGRLKRLTVDIGDWVERGATMPIAELDDEEYAQGVEQARAELTVAQASVMQAQSALSVAKSEYDRVRELSTKKISSDSELDMSRSQYEAEQARYQVAVAEVTRREAALKAAEVRLSYTKIHVSWNGGSDRKIVGERYVDEGAMLSPNTPIVSILDILDLTANIEVIERDYHKIKLGQTATIETDAVEGRTFTGTVARVAPLLKMTSRQARVEIAVENPDGQLKPGMFVRARIELERKKNALVVPSAACMPRDAPDGLYVVDRETMVAQYLKVKFGFEDGGFREVLSPEIDAPVVVVGQHDLTDGAAVTISGEMKAEAGAEAPTQ
jgi:RND family efflux transporter MFP subunit